MPVWFQSAPAIAGGRCSLTGEGVEIGYLFQSAPAIAGGRCLLRVVALTLSSSFNPRPPLLAGDAEPLEVRLRTMQFQSAPAIAGGRCPGRRPSGAAGMRFNPRPPLLAGDAPRCQGIANSSLFPYRARTPAAPSKGQTKIACEKEKPFGNNTLRSARTCLMQRHHFRFAALTIAWHPCPTAPAAHQNPRP